MFHSRLRLAVEKSGYTISEISKLSGVGKRALDKYMGKNPPMPNADAGAAIALVLGVTVEELVLGERGRDYVVDWASRNGARWKPPPHLEELCDDLKKLDAQSLEIVKATVKKIIELKEGAVSEPHPQANAG